MKFENLLKDKDNYRDLKCSIVNWSIGIDDVGGVLRAIPWSADMDEVMPWRDCEERFVKVIGNRRNWTDGNKIAEMLLEGYDNAALRTEFDLYVCHIAIGICKEYEKVIDELNRLTKECIVVRKVVGVVCGSVKYETIARVYADSKYDAICEVWEKFAKHIGKWRFGYFVDAMYKGNTFVGSGNVYCGFCDKDTDESAEGKEG